MTRRKEAAKALDRMKGLKLNSSALRVSEILFDAHVFKLFFDLNMHEMIDNNDENSDNKFYFIVLFHVKFAQLQIQIHT